MGAEEGAVIFSDGKWWSDARSGADKDEVVVDLRDDGGRRHEQVWLSQPRLIHASRFEKAFKRIVDLAVAGSVLILSAPLLFLVALLVVTTSRGPIFYKAPRVGQGGRPFTFFKFRTMYRDAPERLQELLGANEASGPIFKIRRDPRITPVGRLLRRTSIDELPQLFHVLRGRMSLVGPRPHLPEEVRGYSEWEEQRLLAKPGITCTWQVSGRSELDFNTWVSLDLDYIQNWSMWIDLKLLILTIPAVFSGRGAY